MTDTEVIALNVSEARRRGRARTNVDEAAWFDEGEHDTEPFPLDHTVPALRIDALPAARRRPRLPARPSPTRLAAFYIGATAVGSVLGYLLSLLV